MPELFDIVDRQDRPTGQRIDKRQAHNGNVLHRCVVVLVGNEQGGMYVQLHKKSGLLDHAVGGHVIAGESYETAAYREAEEEIGLAGVQLQELYTGFYSREYNMQHMFGVYQYTVPASWQFVPNDEVDELRLMPIADIVAGMNQHPRRFTPGFINTLQYYLKVHHLPWRLNVSGQHWGPALI